MTQRGADEGAGHPKSRGAARRAMRRGPTIDDVAAAAGVSRGTVSRVLNGGHYVSPAATASVERAILETGYVVNTSARSLVTRRADCVAFVLSEPQDLLFADPNFSVLLRTCTHALAELDVALVLMLAGSDAERARVLRFVRGGHVDGVLLVSTHAGDPLLSQLQGTGLPVVACGRPVGAAVELPYVAADDREGARQMARHLVASGRRRVATITGPLDAPGGLERLEGFVDVLGRRATRGRVVSARNYSARSGEVAMDELLARDERPDAVFVASDLLASGALVSLRRHGLRVPDDVAVGGFDDSRIAATTDPPLTTVRQPFDEIARAMVGLLLQGLAQEPMGPVVLPTELVVRGSA